ncbi:MAG: pyruvate dehydrogenase (acetyl-transferring) E1 component subunit alpha [Caldilineae bacterium]|nr:MAG: pyruvate dehydrogenase (acetyl-transferring) E1 component subunit alpha [Caldilineae bacterium]
MATKTMTQTVPVQEKVAVDRNHALHLLREMMRIRRFEGKCAELYTQLKIRGFLHLYDGEEAVAVGVMQALRPEDAVVATYREHGQALARGIPMNAVMAEMYGKQEGCSRGRGGSMHLFDAATRFYGGNAIVGGGLPMAVGIALADKMRGENRVTCCFFGDGAVQEGEFHESMNLAALWQLPVLFVCENNLYAMGVPLEISDPVPELARKADAYAMPAQSVDGMDVLAVEAAAQEAVAHIRAGKGPYFLECKTYRFRAHSMFDAELYRTKEEVQAWRKRDPIILFTNLLKEQGLLADDDLAALEQSVEEEVEAAVAFAEAGTWEPVEDLTRFVYSERRAT